MKSNWATDYISLSGIIAHAIIGVHAHEQTVAQPLSIDLSFSINIKRAAARDSILDTQDYAKIYDSIIHFVEKNSCRLLETLAHRLSDHLQNQFAFSKMQLRITKKPTDMSMLSGVSVVIERS